MKQKRRKSVSAQVRELLKTRPYFVEAMERDIVNYSALARVLREDIVGASEESIKTSLVRLSYEIKKSSKERETKIRGLLKKTKLHLQDKITVILVKDDPIFLPSLAKVKAGDFYIVITDAEDPESSINKDKVKHIQKNLVALTLSSPEELEDIPGVVSYLASALSAEGINLVEFLSCYTETVIIVSEADSVRAYQAIKDIISA